MTRTVCYLAGSAADWGGASRVLFTNLRLIDRARYRPVVLLPYPGKVVEELEKLDIRYLIWGKATEPGNAIAYGKAVWRSLRMFSREDVDLFHMAGYYWRPAEFVAALVLRIPVLMHYHAVMNTAGPAARRADAIVAVSQYVADNSQPVERQKHVIYNSLELAPFARGQDLRGEFDIPTDTVVVTFVGQIRTIKGVDMFLRMSRVLRYGNVRFLIVGACRDPEKFKGAYSEFRLRQEMGDDKRIIYAGYRTDVENVYATSDIVVVPSQWEEPFGLINIEAGAAGKPVVATRVGGIPEVIDHGINGFLVEPNDLDALCRYVSRLVEDPQLRVSMGRNAREVVERNFARKPIEDLQRLYDGLMQ